MGRGSFEDISGQVFGRLTVVRYEGKSKWLCRCECGTEKEINGQSLKRGATKSCGCTQNDYVRSNFKDLTGSVFTRWTVISRADNSETGRARWNCRCACGQEKIVEGQSLRDGRSKSCGCLDEDKRKTGVRQTKRKSDLEGATFGLLTFVKHADLSPGRSVWRCGCGKIKIAKTSNVLSGEVSSCGCLRSIVQKERSEAARIRNLKETSRVCSCCGELKDESELGRHHITKKLRTICYKCAHIKDKRNA